MDKYEDIPRWALDEYNQAQDRKFWGGVLMVIIAVPCVLVLLALAISLFSGIPLGAI